MYLKKNDGEKQIVVFLLDSQNLLLSRMNLLLKSKLLGDSIDEFAGSHGSCTSP